MAGHRDPRREIPLEGSRAADAAAVQLTWQMRELPHEPLKATWAPLPRRSPAGLG